MVRELIQQVGINSCDGKCIGGQALRLVAPFPAYIHTFRYHGDPDWHRSCRYGLRGPVHGRGVWQRGGGEVYIATAAAAKEDMGS